MSSMVNLAGLKLIKAAVINLISSLVKRKTIMEILPYLIPFR